MAEGIVLLHGIFRTKRSMRRLEKFLQQHGYDTLNITYKSTRYAIENIIDAVHPDIEQFAAGKTKLHFIGYSMGGLVIRAYAHKYLLHNMGRVVMLGTPNKGSQVADLVRNLWLYKKLYGPAGQQLFTRQDVFQHIFGELNFELGSIAGISWLDPISSLVIGLPNDGKVSVESTKLDGMKDHLVIRCAHTFFPVNKTAWRQTLHFLQHGFFVR
ncbi:MAG: lipase [Alphaproteobacteria bacterium]|nr:lipase [Alphaproteobacteria bacterium]